MKEENTFIYNGHIVDLDKVDISYLKSIKQEISIVKKQSYQKAGNEKANYKYYNGVVITEINKTR